MNRKQNPQLEVTPTARKRWFIRPYVPIFRNGRLTHVKKRIYLGDVGEMTKAAACAARTKALAQINDQRVKVDSEDNFGELLDAYLSSYVESDNLAQSTRHKYRQHIEHHIRPAFARADTQRDHDEVAR